MKTLKMSAALILASACLCALPALGQMSVKTVDGVTIVMNGKKPDPPKAAATKLVLDQIYSTGGGDSPDESFVGAVAFDVLKDGTAYVLDAKDNRVKVYDAKGKFLSAFGKKGQGPAELNQPVGLVITPENEVLVEDIMNQRLAFYDLRGNFLRHVSTAKFFGLSGIAMDGQGLVVARSMGLGDAGKMYMDIRTYDRDFNPKVKLAAVEYAISLQTKINPFSAMSLLYALDGRGHLLLGSQKGYEIKVLSRDGKLIKTIGREYDPVSISKEDKDEMLKTIPTLAGVQINVKNMIQFPDTFPAYGNFVPADDGRLLVQTYKKGRVPKEFIWDVFDADGRYIAQIPIVHQIRLWRDGKAYFFVEDEDGYIVLKCFRARWEK
jgi:hypothetical protein